MQRSLHIRVLDVCARRVWPWLCERIWADALEAAIQFVLNVLPDVLSAQVDFSLWYLGVVGLIDKDCKLVVCCVKWACM